MSTSVVLILVAAIVFPIFMKLFVSSGKERRAWFRSLKLKLRSR